MLTKYLNICAKICHKAKLQAFVKMLNADDPQPTKSFPKQKDLSRIEQRYVG